MIAETGLHTLLLSPTAAVHEEDLPKLVTYQKHKISRVVLQRNDFRAKGVVGDRDT